MAERRVVVTQRLFDEDAIAFLRANGCAVDLAPLPAGGDGALGEADLAALLADADGWIVGHAHVTRTLLAALPRLAVVSRRGVGYERVDVAAAADLGKVVAIATGGNDAAVADHTVGLMLAVGRRVAEHHAALRAGDWTIRTGTDLNGRTVGVVGLGRIGRGVVRRLAGFGTRTLVATPRPDEAFLAAHGAVAAPLDALLAESDYLTLHLPLTAATRFTIDRAALARMKRGAILVNTARGGLVEDAHLLEALEAGRLGGAGLDVFASEADPAYRAVTEALLARPDVVGTPHAAGSTRESLALTNAIAAQSVLAVLEGGSPPAARVVADGRRTG